MLNQNGKQNDNSQWNLQIPEGKTPEQILAERIHEAETLVERLKKDLARGTRPDIRQDLEIPKAPPREIGARIEEVLRSQVRTTAELAKSVGEPLEKVQAWIKSNRAKLADIGTADTAKWVWRLGDEAPAKELQAMVHRIVIETPMTTAELVKVTGARMARVNGVLVEIQRNPDVMIWNEGSDFRARWHIVPPHAKRANLPPKVSRTRTK